MYYIIYHSDQKQDDMVSDVMVDMDSADSVFCLLFIPKGTETS